MTNSIIRRAKSQDFPQILNNERLCYPTPWSEGLLKHSLTGSAQFFVMLVTNKVMGHLVFQKIVDELHIHNICIHPYCQGQGRAKEWMQFLINYGKKGRFNSILLEVRRSNHRAIQFYDSSGFAKIGCRRDYYSTFDNTTEDALVMEYLISHQ